MHFVEPRSAVYRISFKTRKQEKQDTEWDTVTTKCI